MGWRVRRCGRCPSLRLASWWSPLSGSGGGFALAAARGLIDNPELDAEAVARKAMAIAAGICVFTNDKVTIETL